ncbi:MAG: SCP-like protein extracellular, partial [uncultured bacterium]
MTPLTPEQRLYASSQYKATDMASASYFAHTGPDGRSLASWLDGAGYEYRVAGENLAIGFSDPRALVNAWVNSPTHLANLLDAEYEETGIGLAAGMYDGVPVVYVAQHFGAVKIAVSEPLVEEPIETTVEEEPVETTPVALNEPINVVSSTTFGDVLGTKEDADVLEEVLVTEPLEESIIVTTEQTTTLDEQTSEVLLPIDLERSFVRYEEMDDTHVRIVAFASINMPFRSATVLIGDTAIPLTETEGSYGVLSGSIEIPESVSDYFSAVLVPELRVTNTDGEVMSYALRWQHLPQVSLTPVEQYTASKSLLSSITNLFNVTNSIFFFFIGFFTIALLMNIFWEIRYQHHHVTVQTLGLILL